MIDTILNPQIWLVLVVLGHTIPGVIIPTNWANDTAKMVAGWMLLTSVTLIYAAVCLDGEEQARLALVIAGPVWIWFVVCVSQGFEYTLGKEPMTMNWKDNAPPIVLWGMLALTGLLKSGWI
ncbi:MAG: hypothetical protein CBE08_000740 [Euryarchaeota archaeon TMED248]|nr:MAG: hypothetical protein CBE08_000740 [Euryarchaeota archaeon TMED248]|tara:strand:+ start:327 stop:692 length:366 start_codon:yes stop_codon:yes gene_type:complete